MADGVVIVDCGGIAILDGSNLLSRWVGLPKWGGAPGPKAGVFKIKVEQPSWNSDGRIMGVEVFVFNFSKSETLFHPSALFGSVKVTVSSM